MTILIERIERLEIFERHPQSRMEKVEIFAGVEEMGQGGFHLFVATPKKYGP